MTRVRTAVRLLVALPLVAGLALAACGDDDDTSADDDSTGTTVTAEDLLGRAFEATSVTGQTLVDDSTFSLAFEQDGIVANAGCNTMRGSYEIDGDVLVVEDLAQTMMGCEPALQAQDDWVAALLTGRPTITFTGGTLGTLTLAGDGVTVVFEE